jgi:hypothetical protein
VNPPVASCNRGIAIRTHTRPVGGDQNMVSFFIAPLFRPRRFAESFGTDHDGGGWRAVTDVKP